MLLVFYRVGNSLELDRHSFDFWQPESIWEKLQELPEDEIRVYNCSDNMSLLEFQEEYNDEILDGGWWSILLNVSLEEKKEDELDTTGLLSIMASLIREKGITSENLLDFIKEWKKEGFFEAFIPEFLRDMDSVHTKTNLAETIVKECMRSKEMRIDLQRNFGQFDGAQICQHCGRIMWKGYSWHGDTYCSEECVLDGEDIDKEEFDKCTEDADEVDGECYYTDWY